MPQISLGKTLDVDVVEQELAALWQGAPSPDDETAMLRARAANLLVFVRDEKSLAEVHDLLPELTAAHPSRALIILGESESPDRDIDMYVSAHTQKEKIAGQHRLCCEEVTLKAQGIFVEELPSAALPLLISDLPTFLFWRSVIDGRQRIFNNLLNASDRLIVDSVEFAKPAAELAAINEIFGQAAESAVGISDLNWSRLTSWRGLLADFYDVPAHRASLDSIDNVRISYVAPQAHANAIAPQALLMAGWLASRLQWEILNEPASGGADERLSFQVTGGRSQTITIELQRIKDAAINPGRLAQVELRSSADDSRFKVERSADRQRVVTQANLGSSVQPGRVLPVRNRSTAQLLSREMEILCNDQIYQEAVSMAANMIDASSAERG